jgi:hypothetical protein
MNKYRYFVQTYYQLPPAKFVWENIYLLPFLLRKMIDAKPAKYPLTDVENSVLAVKIDTHIARNWKEIYKESPYWHWCEVRLHKGPKGYEDENGCEKSLEEIKKWVEQTRQSFVHPATSLQ